jgi:CDP-glycerol glycerophosphotransferase (TagB/SpsB family)
MKINIYKYLEFILAIFIPTLLVLVPKKKNLWVFSCWSGLQYSDNSKAFYEYVTKYHKNIKTIWITKDKSLNKLLIKQGVNSFYYLSLKGIYYQVISGVVFITHNIGADLFRPIISKNTIRVNMWHGMPLKKIRFDDTFTYSKMNIRIKSSRWYMYISNERYDNILSLGCSSTSVLSNALGHTASCFIEEGFPRNDCLISDKSTDFNSVNILYMPTFRDAIGSSIDIINSLKIDLDATSKMLHQINATLTIKLHPANYPTMSLIKEVEGFDNIILSESDASALLKLTDILITDYSSVMFDFSIANASIILFCPDYSNYFSTQRESYVSQAIFMSSNNFEHWGECLNKIEEIVVNKEHSIPPWLTKYHQYKIGGSCERLYSFLSNKYNIN